MGGPTRTAAPNRTEPAMNDALVVSLLSLVPKNRAARGMGWLARRRLPRLLHRALVRWYARHYRVDLDEADGTLDDWPTLADFFVRRLKPGARPVDPDPAVLVSPVDARVHTLGAVRDGAFPQADGRTTAVADLLGPDRPGFEASRFGAFAVLYLSPRDYHRVHCPREARLVAWRYRPGRLWPVFPAATRRVPDLFARNERLVFFLDTDLGPVAQVMVGAFGVGRMASDLVPLQTNLGHGPAEAAVDPPVPLDRGAEVGRFELGSTVILLLEADRVDWTVRPGEAVRVGRPLARRR